MVLPPTTDKNQNRGHDSTSSSEEFELDEGILDGGSSSSYLTDSSDSPSSTTDLVNIIKRRETSSISPLPHSSATKIFNDMVHPHLELPSVCYRIINTPQFQRLRNLKQLGLCYHVYPSACHNRFEHCIGTSFLAGKFGKILQKNQPELNIDSNDILCLYIAGLCHDLGHGPFSHSWEYFMKPKIQDYSHEVMSIRMLDYLLEENDLWSQCEAHGLSDKDLVFIKELILGHPLDKKQEKEEQENVNFQGRTPNKHFLYQIVSNDTTKVDVDKFDYILRDCKQLNVNTAFDYERVLDNSRVFFLPEGDDKKKNDEIIVLPNYPGDSNPPYNYTTTIAYRKKISETLEDLFRGRSSLHHKAYQHKVVKIVEEMVIDGLNAALPYFQVTSGTDPSKVFKLSTAFQDISAFMKLTDSVFEQIVNWENGGARAKRIFDNILKRKLYKSLGYLNDPVKKELLDDLKTLGPSLVLIKTRINYGKGSENPLNYARFYEKSRPDILFKQTFQDPKLESKCFVVLRPSYAFEETGILLSDDAEEEKMRIIGEEAKSIITKHGCRLEYE